jgi:hypothetical protein
MSSEAAMMGRQSGDQSKLFYEFRLDDRIPKNHLLRRINVFVTAVLADVHEQLDPYYSEIGRPSVDPELQRIAGSNEIAAQRVKQNLNALQLQTSCRGLFQMPIAA